MAVIIQLPDINDFDYPLTVQMTGDFSSDLSGFKGAIAHARIAKETLDWVHATPGGISLGDTTLSKVANMGNRLSHFSNDLTNFNALVNNFTNMYDWAIETVKHTKPQVGDSDEDWCLDKQWETRLSYSLSVLTSVQM